MFPFLFLSCTFGIWEGWGGREKYVPAPSGWVCKARVRMSAACRDHLVGASGHACRHGALGSFLHPISPHHAAAPCSHHETLETKEWEAWCQRKYQESGHREQSWRGFWKTPRGKSCSMLLWTDDYSHRASSTSLPANTSQPTPSLGLVWRFCLSCLL